MVAQTASVADKRFNGAATPSRRAADRDADHPALTVLRWTGSERSARLAGIARLSDARPARRRRHQACASCADKLHNARAIVADLRTHGLAVFDRFTGSLAGTIWYYANLAEVFARRLPSPLSAELARAVGDMQRLADAGSGAPDTFPEGGYQPPAASGRADAKCGR
jgi:hypothetical protein